MIHLRSSKRHGALVALFARLTGRNVIWCFAFRTDTVVTRGAPACDARVVHAGTGERPGTFVTKLAGLICRDVI